MKKWALLFLILGVGTIPIQCKSRSKTFDSDVNLKFGLDEVLGLVASISESASGFAHQVKKILHLPEKKRVSSLDQCPSVIPHLTAAQSDSRNTLRRMALHAYLAQLPYTDDPEIVKQEAQKIGFQEARRLNIKSTGGELYVFSNDKSLVLSFLGTDSLRDVMQDIKLQRVPNTTWGEVHRGFFEVYKSFSMTSAEATEDVYSILSDAGYLSPFWMPVQATKTQSKTHETKSKGKKLSIVGHSLGGALASLFALDLSHRFKLTDESATNGCELSHSKDSLKAELYTFAAPRVGNEEFVRCLSQNWENRIFRVSDEVDLIPSLPPSKMWFGNRKEMDYVDLPIGFRPRNRIAPLYEKKSKHHGKEEPKETEKTFQEVPEDPLTPLASYQPTSDNGWMDSAKKVIKSGLGELKAAHVSYSRSLFHRLDPTCKAKFFESQLPDP